MKLRSIIDKNVIINLGKGETLLASQFLESLRFVAWGIRMSKSINGRNPKDRLNEKRGLSPVSSSRPEYPQKSNVDILKEEKLWSSGKSSITVISNMNKEKRYANRVPSIKTINRRNVDIFVRRGEGTKMGNRETPLSKGSKVAQGGRFSQKSIRDRVAKAYVIRTLIRVYRDTCTIALSLTNSVKGVI